MNVCLERGETPDSAAGGEEIDDTWRHFPNSQFHIQSTTTTSSLGFSIRNLQISHRCPQKRAPIGYSTICLLELSCHNDIRRGIPFEKL